MGMPRLDIHEARRLRAMGWTLQRIADKFGVTKQWVSAALRYVPKRRPWEEIAPELRELHAQGLSARRIAHRTDCAIDATYRRLKRLGLSPHPPISKKRLRRIGELYAHGMARVEIAATLDVTEGYVDRAVKSLGVKRKGLTTDTTGGAHRAVDNVTR